MHDGSGLLTVQCKAVLSSTSVAENSQSAEKKLTLMSCERHITTLNQNYIDPKHRYINLGCVHIAN